MLTLNCLSKSLKSKRYAKLKQSTLHSINSTIAGDYEEILAAHAAYLSNNVDMNVTIEGHADERGTPGGQHCTWRAIAQAVAKYLQALGVQADQISIVSYGEEKPLLLVNLKMCTLKTACAVLVY